MTWNLETADPPAQHPEIVDRINALELEDTLTVQADQLEAAKAAAIGMIESGALGKTGPDGVHFGATFAGVANVGHSPPEAGPTDRITVEVRQVDYKPPAEPEPEVEEASAEETETEARQQEGAVPA